MLLSQHCLEVHDSLLFGSAIPTSLLIEITSTADCSTALQSTAGMLVGTCKLTVVDVVCVCACMLIHMCICVLGQMHPNWDAWADAS